MRWESWVAVGAAAVAVAALVVGLLLWRRLRAAGLGRSAEGAAADPARARRSAAARPPAVGEEGPLVAFVVNPTKPGAQTLREAAHQACSARYLPRPLWLETTQDDPGAGQAAEALARGARLVVACGGDGTVREVAGAMAGTGVPMGLVPLGTGNLFARNLDLPLGHVDQLVRIALDGSDRPIDIGWLALDRPDGSEDGREHAFLVIGGLGFDADMVADTDEHLKKKVGWLAYFVAGASHLHGRRLRAELSIDGSAPTPMRLRTLLVGNVGRLPGGITLLPDAELDDGWLDIAALDTRGGLLGWVQLFGEVVLQGFGVRPRMRGVIGRIEHFRGRRASVTVSEPQQVQVDGDGLGVARALHARLDENALLVRVTAKVAAQDS